MGRGTKYPQLDDAGETVALPTETVYGLAADARDGAAVARIYAAKGRPGFNPLIVHAADTAAAARIGVIDGDAARLAAAFWPGALTLVVPLRPEAGVAGIVTAGLDTVGLRVPAHPVAQAVMASFGGPLAMPSANVSGRISPTTAAHVLEGLAGRIAANPPQAVRMTKRLLQQGRELGLAPLLELSAQMQALAHASADHREAVQAFLEKRSPRFAGR